MKTNHGFILLAVLLYLQIYTLLGLAAFEQVFLAEKTNADQTTRRLLLNEAERRLSRLAVAPHWRCFIPVTSIQVLHARPLQWWADYACMDNSTWLRSYYVVEALGVDPCASLKDQEQALAAYYRITLVVVHAADERMKVMLQSTVVKAMVGFEHCDSEQHSVDLGSQRWREIE